MNNICLNQEIYIYHELASKAVSVSEFYPQSVDTKISMWATPILGFCNCSVFCCALLCVHSSFAIISMGKRELVALFCLSSWCLVIVVWLFLTMPRVCLQFVFVFVILLYLV